MGIRWIIHKRDGITVKSDWDSNEKSFRENWSKDITSIQLQEELSKELYTLSARNRIKSIFWQTDDFILDPNTGKNFMAARKIFKCLGSAIWLELTLDSRNNKLLINIINKKIKVQ